MNSANSVKTFKENSNRQMNLINAFVNWCVHFWILGRRFSWSRKRKKSPSLQNRSFCIEHVSIQIWKSKIEQFYNGFSCYHVLWCIQDFQEGCPMHSLDLPLRTVADLRGALPAHASLQTKISCFFLENLINILGRHPPGQGWRPLLEEALDPPLVLAVKTNRFQVITVKTFGCDPRISFAPFYLAQRKITKRVFLSAFLLFLSVLMVVKEWKLKMLLNNVYRNFHIFFIGHVFLNKNLSEVAVYFASTFRTSLPLVIRRECSDIIQVIIHEKTVQGRDPYSEILRDEKTRPMMNGVIYLPSTCNTQGSLTLADSRDPLGPLFYHFHAILRVIGQNNRLTFPL